jgi:hypothetical protein
MVALFLFLTGMTGALAPFSYLVTNSNADINDPLRTKQTKLIFTLRTNDASCKRHH